MGTVGHFFNFFLESVSHKNGDIYAVNKKPAGNRQSRTRKGQFKVLVDVPNKIRYKEYLKTYPTSIVKIET